MPVVLCGCKTWSVTLNEKNRLKVFGSRLLRMVFGHKRDGVTGEWRRLHNEELYDLYSSRGIFEWSNKEICVEGGGGHLTRLAERRSVGRET